MHLLKLAQPPKEKKKYLLLNHFRLLSGVAVFVFSFPMKIRFFALCLGLLFSSFTMAPKDQERIHSSLKAFGIGEDVELIPLTGGMDHVMVHVRLGKEEFVLRLLKIHRTEEAIIREVEATQLASECGVGPKLLFFDPVQRILILEYLFPDKGEVDEEKMIQKLRRFQQLSFPYSAASPEPFVFIDRLYQNVSEREATPMFKLIKEAMAVVTQIYEVLKEKPAVVCHGDFHKNNVITSSGEVFLIDWTTAALGDRFYDLAKYTLSMTPEHVEHLLNIYCGSKATLEDKAHFFLTRMATLMTLVLNRYPCIENDTFETIDLSCVNMTAMHTNEEKRLGALKALNLFFERASSQAFYDSLNTLASTSAE